MIISFEICEEIKKNKKYWLRFFLFSYFCRPFLKLIIMYAIVEIAGQQFKVEKDQQIFVHRLEAEQGTNVSFDKVLLLDNQGKINVGAPAVKGASVTAKVMEHLKGDKVIVFKKKRRKGYKVKNGHRQYLTKIEIQAINEKPLAKKAAAKKEEVKTAPKKSVVKKALAKKTVAKKIEKKD